MVGMAYALVLPSPGWGASSQTVSTQADAIGQVPVPTGCISMFPFIAWFSHGGDSKGWERVVLLPTESSMRLKEGLRALLTICSAVTQAPAEKAKEADPGSFTALVWGGQYLSFRSLASPEKPTLQRDLPRAHTTGRAGRRRENQEMLQLQADDQERGLKREV